MSSEIPIDNPAGRLHQILVKAKSITGNVLAREGWAEVFDLTTDRREFPPEKEKLLIQRMLQLRFLIEETEQSLRRIDGIPERYFRPFPRISQIPLTELAHPYANYINQITEGDLTVLEFCAEKLSDHHPEPLADEEQLKNLSLEVEELFTEVKQSVLPLELKTFILRQLETIRRAIQEYRIRGVERLREALSEIVGSIIVNADLVKSAAGTKEGSKFRKVFLGLASLASFGLKTTPLIEPISKIIGVLLPGDPNVPPPPMN